MPTLEEIWSTGPDRRGSVREPAVENRACLEWWERAGARESWARLLDISRSGACLVSGAIPPLHQAVLLRVERPASSDWVRAKVVWIDGADRAGLAFTEPCPDDVLAAASLGIAIGIPAY